MRLLQAMDLFGQPCALFERRFWSTVVRLAATAAVLSRPAGAAAQDRFEDSVVLSGLTNPTAIDFSSDGRVFAAEKSGLILSLILRHPHLFDAAAAWDTPAQFTDMSAFPGMAENFGTEENFDRYEIPSLIRNVEALRQRRSS